MFIDKKLLMELIAAIESGESVWEVALFDNSFKGEFKGMKMTIINNVQPRINFDSIDFIIVDDQIVDKLATSKSDSKRVYMDNILNAIKHQINNNSCHA